MITDELCAIELQRKDPNELLTIQKVPITIHIARSAFNGSDNNYDSVKENNLFNLSERFPSVTKLTNFVCVKLPSLPKEFLKQDYAKNADRCKMILDDLCKEWNLKSQDICTAGNQTYIIPVWMFPLFMHVGQTQNSPKFQPLLLCNQLTLKLKGLLDRKKQSHSSSISRAISFVQVTYQALASHYAMTEKQMYGETLMMNDMISKYEEYKNALNVLSNDQFKKIIDYINGKNQPFDRFNC